MTDCSHLPYRRCAGVMLINGDGHVFVGQRVDGAPDSDAWQMPQGGIDKGEAPLDAAIRELGEETGIAPHLVELVAQSPNEHLYDLPPEELSQVPTVCGSLREALTALNEDRAFLLKGGVFTEDQIDAYVDLKWEEVARWEMTPSPVEFDMYYSG